MKLNLSNLLGHSEIVNNPMNRFKKGCLKKNVYDVYNTGALQTADLEKVWFK
jgi:hypothetical protein